MDISYIQVSGNEIDIIKPLWKKLRDHHYGLSPHFADRYKEFKFEDRKRELLAKTEMNLLKIDIVKDEDTQWLVGYCISSISPGMVGEIDSIYLEENYRDLGIGDELMNRALSWMDSNRVKFKRIVVAQGNEDLLTFYERYDFYPRHLVLEQK